MIRSGQSTQARKQLARFLAGYPKGLPRAALAPTASLARRLGLFSLAIRILHSAVRPGPRTVSRASPAEQVEYAGSLIQLGRSEESRALLADISRNDEPIADLFAAFGLFSEWNYRAAIPLLESYVRNPRLTDYQRHIGEVNLVAALVIERENAVRRRSLLETLLTVAEQEGSLLLYGNLLEIAAQDAVYDHDPVRAEELLKRAPTQDDIMVRKWRAVLAVRADRTRISGLLRVRRDALRAKNWETVRECDLFHGAYGADQERLRRAFFGTPYPAYRERVRSFSPYDFSIDLPTIRMGTGGPLRKESLDLRSPEACGFAPAQVPHRLLLALVEDSYRPPTIASLHAKVFPGQHFNPFTSPQQVHQGLKRLRRSLTAQGWAIREQSGRYSIAPLRYERRLILLPSSLNMAELRGRSLTQILTGHGPFAGKSSDAARIWGVSLRSANRELARLVDAGVATRSGRGRATVYSVFPF